MQPLDYMFEGENLQSRSKRVYIPYMHAYVKRSGSSVLLNLKQSENLALRFRFHFARIGMVPVMMAVICTRAFNYCDPKGRIRQDWTIVQNRLRCGCI